jgi:hypothetical protein
MRNYSRGTAEERELLNAETQSRGGAENCTPKELRPATRPDLFLRTAARESQERPLERRSTKNPGALREDFCWCAVLSVSPALRLCVE